MTISDMIGKQDDVAHKYTKGVIFNDKAKRGFEKVKDTQKRTYFLITTMTLTNSLCHHVVVC